LAQTRDPTLKVSGFVTGIYEFPRCLGVVIALPMSN